MAFSVVTGAFSYTGQYIAQRLLGLGQRVKTLTRRRPAGSDGRIDVAPLEFADWEGLVGALRGATVLYNTYWVRFPYGRVTFEQAVANTERLIEAAVAANVPRIVHISVTNASPTSSLPYFKGKGLVEEAISTSSLSYAMIRPTLLFGFEDILLNNIAWLLRHLPIFGIPGSGQYRVQPVSVEDVADLAMVAGARTDNIIQDAVGPEIYTFDALVNLIRKGVGSRAHLRHLSPRLAIRAIRLLGFLVHDVILTSDELRGLMQNLLVSAGPPTGRRRLSEWVMLHGDSLGLRYANELSRHFREKWRRHRSH